MVSLNEFQKELDIIRTENKELYDRANKNLGSEKIEDNVKLMQKVNDLLDKDIP